MPAKVYVQSPPYGDFRAMPALGGGFALLKWITSFPGNLAKGLPTVNGVVCLSDAATGLPLALLDARAVTALRTGAVAAVASLALAPADARSVGIVGCGLQRRVGRALHGRRRLRAGRLLRPARRGRRRRSPTSSAGAAGDRADGARLRRRLLRDARAPRSSSRRPTCARAST